jgi:hypothetical protein
VILKLPRSSGNVYFFTFGFFFGFTTFLYPSRTSHLDLALI